MKKLLQYSWPPLFIFLVWEILSRTGVFDIRFFPPPSMILHHLFFISPSEGILTDITASLSRIFWGYISGVSLGVIVGISMGVNPMVRQALFPLVALAYPIPKIAILPLIMLIFGIGELSKIIVVAIGSFFLVLMNTLHGVESLAQIYNDVAKIYRISYPNYLLKIIFPGALPSIFTGLKLAIGYSLVIVVAAEFSGANAGIGYLIWQSWETFSINSMYAGIFVLAFFGFVFAISLDHLEHYFIRWNEKKK